MILGFILLTSNIEMIVQKLFTYIFFIWTKTHIRKIVIKNLIGHRKINQITGLMFSLSVGVFIMLIVSTKIEFDANRVHRRKYIGGSDSRIVPDGKYFLTPKVLKPIMERLVANKLVKDYTFISPRLDHICCPSTLLNKGKSASHPTEIIGITPNFNSILDKEFLTIESEYISNTGLTPSEQLYLLQNKGRVSASAFIQDEINLQIDDSFIHKIFNNKEYMIHLFKPANILSGSPFAEMSKSGQIAGNRYMIMNYQLYTDILSKTTNYFYSGNEISEGKAPMSIPMNETPIDLVLINIYQNTVDFNDKVEKEIRDNFNLEFWLETDAGVQRLFDRNQKIILTIFYSISVVIIIFCLFNLSTTMIINIFEQKKELAIYRSLGLTRAYINFIYVGETFILIFSSSFIGLMVGTVISWTMLMQRVLFTNLPLSFRFPYQELLILLVLAVVGGILCTFFTIRKVSKLEISSLIKN